MLCDSCKGPLDGITWTPCPPGKRTLCDKCHKEQFPISVSGQPTEPPKPCSCESRVKDLEARVEELERIERIDLETIAQTSARVIVLKDQLDEIEFQLDDELPSLRGP